MTQEHFRAVERSGIAQDEPTPEVATPTPVRDFVAKILMHDRPHTDYGTGYYVKSQDYATGVGGIEMSLDEIYGGLDQIDQSYPTS